MTSRSLMTAILVAACHAGAAGQPPAAPPQVDKSHVDVPAGVVRQRVDAFVKALSSGDAGQFEAMAQAHFEPAMLARRTPDERRELVARIGDDFGTIALTSMERRHDDSVVLLVRGTTGTSGRIESMFGPPPDQRIARMGIRLGDGDGDRDGSSAPAINATMSPDELSRQLDAYLAPLAASGDFSGVVLVAKAGAPVYEKAFGEADRARALPNTPTTRFNIGSINKIFTKTAILQLISRGTLRPSDTIDQLLPDYPNATSKSATVGQLLEHQAGIADFFGPQFDAASKDQFQSNADYYRFVASLPPVFAPGARRQYCNGCYIVLGQIVAKVVGVPYEDYVARHVYAPAGMATAGPTSSSAAVGYTRRGGLGEGPPRSNASMHGVSGSAAGGGYATARDLLAFDSALRSGALADASTTAQLLQVAKTTPGRSDGNLGVAGGAAGLNAILESSRDWTVIVLANLDPPAAEQVGAAIHRQLTR